MKKKNVYISVAFLGFCLLAFVLVLAFTHRTGNEESEIEGSEIEGSEASGISQMKLFTEILISAKIKRASVPILIEGTITDDQGNALNGVTAYVDFSREEIAFTDNPRSETKHLQETVDSAFRFEGKGYDNVSVLFVKEGYAQQNLQFDAGSFVGGHDDSANLIQRDLRIVMKKLPLPVTLKGFNRQHFRYDPEKGTRTICDLSRITRDGKFPVAEVAFGKTPDAKCWLEIDLKRDPDGGIASYETTYEWGAKTLICPEEFILRLHSDDPDDGFALTALTTTSRAMDYVFRYDCLEAPEGPYSEKEFRVPYDHQEQGKVVCAYLKVDGHYGKFAIIVPIAEPGHDHGNAQLGVCRYQLRLYFNIKPDDRGLFGSF